MSHALTDQTTQEFFDDPTVARFRAIQQQIFQSEAYDPSAADLLRIEQRLARASPVRLLGDIARLSPMHCFAPRFHYIDARIRESLGEVTAMQQAVLKLKTCLRIITQTGEGSTDSPFAISFLPDQDDVIRALGEELRCRHLATSGEGHFEVITTHSGLEFWFDIRPLLAAATPLRGRGLVAEVRD